MMVAGRPAAAVVQGVARVAILGAGAEGSSLARRGAQIGYRVTLEDLMPAKRRAAAAMLGDLAAFAYPITLAGTVEEAVRDADLVIDFVPDELESKLEILSMLDRMAPPRTIFATPTRVLSIADLASCTYRGERCVALRLTESSGEVLAVEIVAPPQASPLTVDLVQGFWQSLGVQVTTSIDEAPLP